MAASNSTLTTNNSKPIDIVIIDNYDSFTYNLMHLVEEIIGSKVTVLKNDQLTLASLQKYSHIILSPGPGLPNSAGLLKPIITEYKDTKKILGVCLGLQAIGEVFGCTLINLENVYHGIQSEINIILPASKLYKNINNSITVGRYHSWVINEETIGSELRVTSKDAKGQIMSIEHKSLPLFGVQYHPESIMTPDGRLIIENFLNL